MCSRRDAVGHVLILASVRKMIRLSEVTSANPADLSQLNPGIHWTVIKDDLRSLCPPKSKGPGRVDVYKYSCTVKMDNKEDAEVVHGKHMKLQSLAERMICLGIADTAKAQLTERGLPRFPGLKLLVHYMQTFANGCVQVVRCNGAETVCRDGNHLSGCEENFGAVQVIFSQAIEWTSLGTASNLASGYSIATPAASTVYSATVSTYTGTAPPTPVPAIYWQPSVSVCVKYSARAVR